MANVKINKKLFEKEIGKLDEKMQEKISLMGTPIDKISNEEIEVEIFPNRPDLLSYHGFKRALLAFLGKKTGIKEYKLNKPEKDYRVIIESSVKNIRPYTACAIVKNLKFDNEKIKEIIDIQEKIHITLGRDRKKLAIGIYPLEKIKLPITFKALEPDKIKFIPLETDKEMSGLQILQRHPTGKKYAHLLAGKEKFPIFIDGNNQILSMPPIINSQQTGKITEQTKEVFIECSGFNFEVLKKCLNIITTILAEMGGEIYQMEIEFPKEKYEIWKNKKEITPNLTPEKMKISIDNTNKLIGINIKEKEMEELLGKMGYKCSKGIVEIPPYRTDILHEVDIIEDIAIAYGYDKLIPIIPQISTIGQEEPKETIKRKISEIITGLGFLEISNFHLTTKNEQFKRMMISEKETIEVENSKTEFNVLRKNLTHYTLKILSENVDVEYPQKLFEIGKVFELKENEIVEKDKLCISVTPGNFTDLKQILEYLSKMLEFKIELIEPKQFPPHFIDGRVAEIILNKKSIGFAGEIHPRMLKEWKIKMPIGILEIYLEEVFEGLKN